MTQIDEHPAPDDDRAPITHAVVTEHELLLGREHTLGQLTVCAVRNDEVPRVPYPTSAPARQDQASQPRLTFCA